MTPRTAAAAKKAMKRAPKAVRKGASRKAVEPAPRKPVKRPRRAVILTPAEAAKDARGPAEPLPVSDQDAPEAIRAPRVVPILPVRHTVLFPYALLPVSVGNAKSVQLVNDAMAGDRVIAVFTQREPAGDDVAVADLHMVGTLATVLRMLRAPNGQISILLQGVVRVRLDAVKAIDPYLSARVVPLDDVTVDDIETEALTKAIEDQFGRIVELSPTMPDEAVPTARSQQSPSRTGDFIASLLDLPVEDKQRLLEILDVKQRLRALTELLARQLQVLEVGQQIQESVQSSLDERQREYVLRQQLAAIQKELGEGDESQREAGELAERIEKANMPPEVRKEADRELARLARIPPQAAEYTVARTYLEWLVEMPWSVLTEDNLDLKHVRAVLDADHYGLEKIKERLLEYLAVRRFKRDARTPILCFVGPPGTGKTSLGQSIARALGRKFVRQSMGGVRDEAEIRGHRRTYIGALPGAIVRGIRRAGSRNPLFMLDEIDKLGADFRGDPSSALLEVLDPQQNSTFMDHYLDVPLDLSQVMFVTTANYLDPVPPALRDRMEVIELSGYTDTEKLEIAKRHLIPKTIAENGLESLGVTITDEAILKIAREYTLEAGLRNLDRELATVLRRTAKLVAEGAEPARSIDAARVRELLGPEKFQVEKAIKIEQPGAALGLAWTPYGGEVLIIEATAMPGSKQLQLTGQLGDVMKESAFAALSYIRTHAEELGIAPDFYENIDLHIHLPAGAIAKDGPSAGITLCTALVSLLTGRKVRGGIAMTGEITLLGRVLPIGGLKEKVLAAHRLGIKTVIMPAENQNDLEEIPLEARTHIIFAPVESMDQVLGLALEPLTPEQIAAAAAAAASVAAGPTEAEPTDGETAPEAPAEAARSAETVVARRRG
jgi:ATP-dependent Lon protease